MENIPVREATVYWNPHSADVAVRRFGGRDRDTDAMVCSDGAAFLFWRNADIGELYFRLAALAVNLIVCDKVGPAAVHAAFLVIPEYRRLLCADSPDALRDEDEHLLETPGPVFSGDRPG